MLVVLVYLISEFQMASTSNFSTNQEGQWGTHWHIRIHDPTPEYLEELLDTVNTLKSTNYLTYGVIGKEVTDAGTHIHMATGTYRCVNKFTLAAKFKCRNRPGVCRQWYIAPIYPDSTPQRNAEYCKKGEVLLEFGKVPEVPVNMAGAEASKGQKQEKWQDMINLAKAQKWQELEKKYPYEFIVNGGKLKALYFIQHTPEGRSHNQHLWIYGPPGTGKSCLVEVLFPSCYKKRPDADWLGYNPLLQPGHSTVYLGDFDVSSMRTLKPENLKLMCDPQGFNANKKFGGGEIIAPGRVVVTSNFQLNECFMPDQIGIEQQKKALNRRFRVVHINEILREHKLKLRSKEQLKILKEMNNFDFSKCFENVKEKEVMDLTNPIDKAVQQVIDLTKESSQDFQENANRLRTESLLTESQERSLFNEPPSQEELHKMKKRKFNGPKIIEDSDKEDDEWLQCAQPPDGMEMRRVLRARKDKLRALKRLPLQKVTDDEKIPKEELWNTTDDCIKGCKELLKELEDNVSNVKTPTLFK